jgi:acetylornithine/N-succinyldiaminopimelate aminotransferase
LDDLADKSENVLELRGLGLMRGLVLREPVGEVIQKALDQGLLVIAASGNVLRMVPPLIITKADVDEAMDILQGIL